MGGNEEKLGENERGATAESSNNRKQQGREGEAHKREGRREGKGYGRVAYRWRAKEMTPDASYRIQPISA